MTHPGWRKVLRAIVLVALPATLLVGAPGCETMTQDLEEVFHLNSTSPTQASSWMFHRDPERRRTGIALISNAYFGGEEPYMKVYREAIADDDPMVRAAAAHALAMHGTPADAPLLASALQDDSSLVRWESARGLQRLHERSVVPALIDAATRDEDLDVRMAAANALGQYRERRVIAALIRALDDRSVGVAMHARRSLRLLTGQKFDTSPVTWLDWSQNVEDPFVDARTYTYPVYTRQATFLEKMLPLRKPVFEEPGIPAGMDDSASVSPTSAPGS